jgi:hypothetical protein
MCGTSKKNMKEALWGRNVFKAYAQELYNKHKS